MNKNICIIILFLSIQNLYALDQIKKWAPRIAGVAAIGYTVYNMNNYLRSLVERDKEKTVLAEIVLGMADKHYTDKEQNGIAWYPAPHDPQTLVLYPRKKWSQLNDDEKLYATMAALNNGRSLMSLRSYQPCHEIIANPKKNRNYGQELVLSTHKRFKWKEPLLDVPQAEQARRQKSASISDHRKTPTKDVVINLSGNSNNSADQ